MRSHRCFSCHALCKIVIHNVAERGKIIIAVDAVHAIVNGDQANAFHAQNLHDLSDLEIVAPRAAHVLYDQTPPEDTKRCVLDAIEVGIALGANVVIANAIGRDDREAVKKAVHAGMHGSMISGMLRKKFNIRRSSTAGMWTLRLIAVLLAVCGIYAFAKHKISSYLFLRTQFVFIDFSQPVALVLLDYLAIIVLFAMVGHCISKVINKNKRPGNW